MVTNNQCSFAWMRQSPTNRELSMLAQFSREPRTKVEVAVESVLHYLVPIFGDPILKLGHLNPMNMVMA